MKVAKVQSIMKVHNYSFCILKQYKIPRGDHYEKSEGNEGKGKDQKSAPW